MISQKLNADALPVRHDLDEQKFYASVKGDNAVLEYDLEADGDVICLQRTHIPEALKVTDLHINLTEAAVQYARDTNKRLRIVAPYIKPLLEGNLAYDDVLVDEHKA